MLRKEIDINNSKWNIPDRFTDLNFLVNGPYGVVGSIYFDLIYLF